MKALLANLPGPWGAIALAVPAIVTLIVYFFGVPAEYSDEIDVVLSAMVVVGFALAGADVFNKKRKAKADDV